MTEHGDIRVWHIPQVPGPAFYFKALSPEEAFRVCGALADYDLFQLENRIKPDYCNANGVERFNADDDSWEEIDREEYAWLA